jgi:thiol-disulfide isomerase/thioredoxin
MRLALLPLLALLTGCADKKSFDAATERIAALEKKVEELEKKGAPGAARAAVPDSPEETAAMELMKAAQTAQRANDYPTAKAKLAELQEKYATTRAGKSAVRLATEINLVGSDAKPIEVEKWFQGKASLTDSPATLLVFWETWCPHCKREMPKMQPNAEKWKAKGVQVVGLTKITKSSTEEAVTTFIKENEIKFPMAKEKEGSMSAAYAVSGIPAAALVKDGKVIWRGHPSGLTDEVLQGLLDS